MFLSSKRSLIRENEELKAQIAALAGQAPQRQSWGLGLDQGKNDFDRERLDLERARLQAEKHRFEAQSARSYAGQAVQALLFLNGSAALALLAFIGALSREAAFKGLLSGLSDPLSLFAHGAALAVLTAISAYLGQASSADENALWGKTLQLLAMVLAFGSLILFVGGISHAHAVFAAFH